MAEGTSPGKEDLGPPPAGVIMECGYLEEPARRPAIEQEPAAGRFFATVFLGSGVLFAGMLFVAAAVPAGLIAARSRPAGPPGADTLTLGRNVTSVLLNVYAMRMAAVFTLTTVTIAGRTHIVSRWLEVAGLVTALVLLVGVGIAAWVELLFPAWILALSIDILTARTGSSTASTGTAPQS
jgi:hypothetical protein